MASALDDSDTNRSDSSTRSIECMEVWGGSEAFEAAVSVPGNDVRVSCTPHDGSPNGGDIYYISNCASGLISRFMLADVSGHGAQLGKIALELRTLMRRHMNTANQAAFAVELNRAFSSLDLDGRFATAILATYFTPTDHLIVCNAGHPRPLLFRATAQTWESLDIKTPGVIAALQPGGGPIGIANLPLGVIDPTDYQQLAIRLQPGDRVVLYTDALIEAVDASGVQLGEEGLLGIARSLPTSGWDDITEAMRHAISEYTGGGPLNDDATLIVLHHNAANPPALTWAGHARRLARTLGLGAIDSGPGIRG